MMGSQTISRAIFGLRCALYNLAEIPTHESHHKELS